MQVERLGGYGQSSHLRGESRLLCAAGPIVPSVRYVAALPIYHRQYGIGGEAYRLVCGRGDFGARGRRKETVRGGVSVRFGTYVGKGISAAVAAAGIER